MASNNSRSIASVLGAVPTKWWFFAVAAVILAASALFGGLADADEVESDIPVVAVGDAFAGPELTTVIHSAELTDLAPGYSFEPEDGNTYLVVTATVTNTYRVTSITFSDLLQLEWLNDDTNGVTDRTALLSDGTSLPQANPGVPAEVAFVWEVPVGSVEPGDTVRVTIRSKSFTEDGDVTFGSYWADPVAAAYVDVEVDG